MADDWVRRNGFDSSFKEGERFYRKMEQLASNGDPAALNWLARARAEAGHRELNAACNRERVIVPTPVGPRDTTVRGVVTRHSTAGRSRQRVLFVEMTVGQYVRWFRAAYRQIMRDQGVLDGHARIFGLVRGCPKDLTVGAALARLGDSWHRLMADVA